MYFMKRSYRRKLFNAFAFALLAFAIYLTVFRKDDDAVKSIQSSPTASHRVVVVAGENTH